MERYLSPERKAKLERIAAVPGRDIESLVHGVVERLVGYDERFLRQVEMGLGQIGRGEVFHQEEVIARTEKLITRKQRPT